MPWLSKTAGTGAGILTLDDGSGNWYGTMISSSSSYSPAPWLNDPGAGGTAKPNPGIIWYWVR